jgi:membrane protein
MMAQSTVMSPGLSPKAVYQLFRLSVESWLNHRDSSRGAALAFYTLFSMTPILILSIAIAGYFFGTEAAQGQIIEQIQSLVGPNGAEAIQALIAAARDPEAGLWATAVAITLLIVGATSVFAELKSTLDDLWETDHSEASGIGLLLKTRLLSLSLVLVLAFLLLISLVVSALLSMLENYVGGIWSNIGPALSLVSVAFSFLVISVLFAMIYKLLPDVPLSWHDVIIGAIFTAALFTLGKYFIGLYLGNSAVASSFGAAGSIVAVMLWIYYSAQIFFFGAEFTRQYALLYGSLKDQPKTPRPNPNKLTMEHHHGQTSRS